MKFVILLHKVLYDYVTLFDVYECSINLETTESGIPPTDEKRQQFEAVDRWFPNDWKRIEPKLRTSIVEGISVFLSLFDDNPAVKRTFCPVKECYGPELNCEGKYGKPLPPFPELIEKGAVCALNFPVSMNPGLARAIGTFMKLDFQRAVLNRIPAMERCPDKYFRQVLFLCDEYHAFATVGENDPTGDEKFFSLSRQARCIPIVATQSISSLRSTLPGESWRALLQTFRTKVFLSLSDDFSTRVASDLCGKEEQLKEHYSMSESGIGAGVNLLTGRSTAHKTTVNTSKSYSVVRAVFEPAILATYRIPDPRSARERDQGQSRIEGLHRERRRAPWGARRDDRRREPAGCDPQIARALGDEIDEVKSLLDSRLPDGPRVAAVFPPCSVGGTTLTFKFQSRFFAAEELVRIGTLTPEVLSTTDCAFLSSAKIFGNLLENRSRGPASCPGCIDRTS